MLVVNLPRDTWLFFFLFPFNFMLVYALLVLTQRKWRINNSGRSYMNIWRGLLPVLVSHIVMTVTQLIVNDMTVFLCAPKFICDGAIQNQGS